MSTPAHAVTEMLEAAARHVASEHDPDLAPLLEHAALEVASSRPLDGATGKRLGVALRLLLAPRDLGRALASASLQDRLSTIVADAVARADADSVLLELSLGSFDAELAPAHPYRTPTAVVARRASASGMTAVEAVREIVAGYLEGQPNAPAVEVSAYADEIVIEIDADVMVFSPLARALRDAAQRVAPKVLLQRRRI